MFRSTAKNVERNITEAMNRDQLRLTGPKSLVYAGIYLPTT